MADKNFVTDVWLDLQSALMPVHDADGKPIKDK